MGAIPFRSFSMLLLLRSGIKRHTMKHLFFFAVIISSIFVQAQTVPSAGTTPDFFKPRFAMFMAPLAMADYIGGYNFRVGTEYSLGEKVNGLTEVSVYMPWHQKYHHVSGFRIRQDFRKYNMKDGFFLGASFMVKQQKIDHIAVLPITDTTYNFKPYTLSKIVVSPSFTVGYNSRIDEHWYVDVSAYAGFRVKNANAEGLTPSERNSMWNKNVDYNDYNDKIMLRQGQHVGIELQASLRIGYVFH